MRLAGCPTCGVVHEAVGADVLYDADEERRYNLMHCRLCKSPSAAFLPLPDQPDVGEDELGYPMAVVPWVDGAPRPRADQSATVASGLSFAGTRLQREVRRRSSGLDRGHGKDGGVPSSKLGGRGQTTIPREIREALKVRPGDKLTMKVMQDGAVLIRKKGDQVAQAAASERTSKEQGEAVTLGLLEAKLRVPADFDAPLPQEVQTQFEAPLEPLPKTPAKRRRR